MASEEEEPTAAASSQAKFLNVYDDSNKYAESLLRSVVQATKAANDLPGAGEDFEYFSSFASFRQVMLAEGKSVLKLMSSLASHQVGKGKFEGLDLEEKFDLLADINDTVLERVGNNLDEADGVKKKADDVVLVTVSANRPIHTSWNKKNLTKAAKFHLLAAKNVTRPQLSFKEKVDNSNTPFVPILRDKPHSLKPLAILPESTSDGQESYGHPYEWEIEHFEPSPTQLKAPSEERLPPPLEETPCTIVETVDQLKDMCEALSKETEIAVDLEHHSYRSFQGFTCLMQISSRTEDYIVDTLALRHELQMLNEVFADPKIVKVFHGADMDVLWLQRDFGLYLVGLFDTGQAAKVLGLAHFSLAFLLKHYCQIEADKQFQLADWRIRPLPPEMVSYAQSDTHYLLYIMDRMKRDLADRSNENDNLLRSVFDRSKQVALRRYEKPSYHEQSYMELYRKSRKTFNSRQLHALRHLYSWRDRTARNEDESTGYVLPNHMILEISEILPREQQGIVACCNPCPPLVRQNLNELHTIILKAREVPLNERSLPEESSWPVAVQVDLDSVLHCVHDRPRHDDATLALPTLLDEDAELLPAEKPTSQLLTKAVPSLGAIAAKVPHTKPRGGTFVLPYKRYMAAVERDGPEVEASQMVTATGESTEPRVAKEIADPGEVSETTEVKQEEEEGEETPTAATAASYEDTALAEPLRSPRKTPRRQRGKRKRQEPDVGLLPDGQTYNSAQVNVPSDETAEDSSRGGTDFKPFDYAAQTPQVPKGQKKQPWSYNPEGPDDMKAGKRKRRRQQVKSRTFGNSSGEPVAKWPKR
uniref:Exosome complex component 10 homolog n=1 Tax=Rhipicephalus zambeziensis TaxID=60191 RepID=A0A224YSY7_9ACAR